jgi:hypothetical protein
VDFDTPYQETTKMIYENLIFNLNVVPRVEIRTQQTIGSRCGRMHSNQLENDHESGPE